MGTDASVVEPDGPVASIVVPAHNEEAVIAANLGYLLASAGSGEFDVIVVPNACADRTADVARQFPVRVVETDVPGKSHAIRLGDEVCRTFPRVYLDADVRLSTESVRSLVEASQRPGVLACAPTPRLDLDGVGRVVRRVHRVHDLLMAPTRALAGVGVYVLTEEGHARVFPIPADLISDDGWVHASFAADERVVAPDAESTVRPARTVAAHLRRRLRVRRGNRQLAALGRVGPDGQLRLGSIVTLVTQRRVRPLDAGCYLMVLVVDRVLTRVHRRQETVWASDASSRVPAAARD